MILVQRDIIFLEPIADTDETTLDSGIILSVKASRASTARIAEIHPDTGAAYELDAGDEVVFNPFSVREINLSSTEKRLALHVSDVLAKVQEQQPTDEE